MLPMPSLRGTIEVERKFVPLPGVEDHLRALGAELQYELVFQDSYYDRPDFRLTLADLWLRRRGDRWELKQPPAWGARGLRGASTQYLELSRQDDIARRVSEELGAPSPLGLDALGLQPFATFVTHRRQFQLPPRGGAARGVVVDLDTADFGFAVGEVEVLAETQEEAQSALREVEEICQELGVLSDSPVPGKMSTFLRLNRPEHYARLVEASVL
ncbi:hypothetical protein FKM82_030327 [Ascaphus truei]